MSKHITTPKHTLLEKLCNCSDNSYKKARQLRCDTSPPLRITHHTAGLVSPYLCRRLHLKLFKWTSLLFSCDKNAFPGFEKGIVYEVGNSEIEELQETSFDVTCSGKETADADGNSKRLYNNRYVYQPNIKYYVTNCHDNHQYKYNQYNLSAIYAAFLPEGYQAAFRTALTCELRIVLNARTVPPYDAHSTHTAS